MSLIPSRTLQLLNLKRCAYAALFQRSLSSSPTVYGGGKSCGCGSLACGGCGCPCHLRVKAVSGTSGILLEDKRIFRGGFGRNLFTTPISWAEAGEKGEEEAAGEAVKDNGNGEEAPPPEEEVAKEVPPPTGRGRLRGHDKDRTKVISVEVSMRYLKSPAYKESYGDNLVWVLYRRNFKGQFVPKKTRRTCIRQGQITTGNPCPICRDEYLVLDHRNVDLLKQFISPFNGEILSYFKTGLCQVQHEKLVVEVLKARDTGLITFDLLVREYDYAEYQHLYDSYKSQSA